MVQGLKVRRSACQRFVVAILVPRGLNGAVKNQFVLLLTPSDAVMAIVWTMSSALDSATLNKTDVVLCKNVLTCPHKLDVIIF